MRSIYAPVLAALALVACGLDQSSGPLGDVGSGRYTATITVNDGRVIEGTLDIVVHPDSTITGTKSLSLKGGGSTDFIQPLLEGGEVRGHLYSDRVVLELNPLYADHNFAASGRPSEERVTGLVTHVGFVGAVETIGTFVARKH